MKRLLSLLVLLAAYLPTTAAAAAHLDGFRIYSSGTVKITGTAVRSVAVHPADGSIIIGGSFTATAAGGSVARTNLARLSFDGILDPAFPESPLGEVFAVAVEEGGSGRIVVGGSFTTLKAGTESYQRRYLARLAPDGVPDDFDPLKDAQDSGRVSAIALSSSSVVAGGSFGKGDGSYRNLVEISADGGTLSGYPGVADGEVLCLLVQRDGKVVAGGAFGGHLARFAAGGADASLASFPNGTVRGIAQQPDGKLILGGEFTELDVTPGGAPAAHLSYFARVAGDGTPDSLNPAFNAPVSALLLQPDGRIAVAGSFTAAGATSLKGAARLLPGGAPDLSFHPDPDGAVGALALQPDGKLLIAGAFGSAGGQPRSMLARFYPYGTLDDDIFCDPSVQDGNGDVYAISLRPDGKVAIGGTLSSAFTEQWEQSLRILRLTPEWQEDGTIDIRMEDHVNQFMLTPRPQPDQWDLTAGGGFWYVNAETQYFFLRLTDSGARDGTLYNGKTFDQNMNDLTRGSVFNYFGVMARVPTDFASPEHTLPGDPTAAEKSYVGVNSEVFRFESTLLRVGESGEKDAGFSPPTFHSLEEYDDDYSIRSMVLQPDGKVIIGGSFDNGVDPQVDNIVLRLLPNGKKDPDFHPPTLKETVLSLLLQKDGGIVLGGWIDYGGAYRQIMRLDPYGGVDPNFTPDPIEYRGGPGLCMIYGMTLQADGKIIISGVFDHVGGFYRPYVARLNPDGTLDRSFDMGEITPPWWVNDTVVFTSEVLPDGKVVLGGNFTAIDSDSRKTLLARISSGFAGEKLTVTPTGGTATVRWERFGAGPEVWGVTFEYSEQGDSWTFLGRGGSVDGGWELGTLPLERGRLGYVRARAYTMNGGARTSSCVVESVRQFYLPPPTHLVTFASAGHGAIGGAASQTVADGGATEAVTAIPDPGYRFAGWSATGFSSLVNPLVLTNVTTDLAVTASFQAEAKLPQQIAYLPVSRSYGDPPLDLSPFFTGGGSGNPVTLSLLSGPATLQGTTLTVSAAGTVRVRASQGGNGVYEAAPDLDIEVPVGKRPAVVTAADPDPSEAGMTIRCVSTSAELQQALSSAWNDRLSAVRLVQGRYPISAALTSYFSGVVPAGGTLHLTGGYTPGCLARDPDPEKTVLDGAGIGHTFNAGILNLRGGAGSAIRVKSLTFQGGLAIDASSAGALAIDTQGGATVESCVFRGNTGRNAGALQLSAWNAASPVIVRNNLMVGNSATIASPFFYYGGAMTLSVAGGQRLELVNNTVTGNRSAGGAGGIKVTSPGSGSTIELSNNIVTGNVGSDGYEIAFPEGAGALNLRSNALDTAKISAPPMITWWPYAETPAPLAISGTVSADPLFAAPAAGDYRLSAASPALDAGDAAAPDLAVTDLIGAPRVGGGTPDLGAYEYHTPPFVALATGTGKIYGEPDPALPVAADGFLPADYALLSFSATRAPGKDVGSYAITPAADSGMGILAQYQVSYLPGIFTIFPRDAAVSVADAAKEYRDPDPPFVLSSTGFLPEDLAPGKILLGASRQSGEEVGSYAITPSASDSGTGLLGNYTVGYPQGTLTIAKASQCITFPAIGERTYGDDPFAISAVSCSGAAVHFTTSDPQVLSVDANGVVTVRGAGSAEITAADDGSGNYDPATPVVQRVVVHQAGQHLSFAPVSDRALGDAPFSLAATASSALPVSYSSSHPEVATVSGAVVTIVGVGTTVITAHQGGDGNHYQAEPVSQPLTVSLEAVPPLLALSTLSSGAVTANPVLNLQGVAGDNSGIRRISVNGAELAGESGSFSIGIPLAAGVNTVAVTAEDSVGNRTTDSRSIILDAAAPALSLTAPADNSVTGDFLLRLAGESTEESVVTVRVNGGAAQNLGTVRGSFSATVALSQGVNTVEVSASARGRSALYKRSVTLAPGMPAVAIGAPPQDLRTEESTFTVKGSAGKGGDGVSVAVELDGVRYAPAVIAGSFQQQLPLPQPGRFHLKVTATDAAGKRSVAYRDIIRRELIVGDLSGDGVVDVRDALALLRLSVGIDQQTPAALAHGDVAPLVLGVPQPDGRLDIGDVVVLLRRIVGLVDF